MLLVEFGCAVAVEKNKPTGCEWLTAGSQWLTAGSQPAHSRLTAGSQPLKAKILCFQ